MAKTITIKDEVHAALAKAAEERGVGIGALAESLLFSGIAKRDRDRARQVKLKSNPATALGEE